MIGEYTSARAKKLYGLNIPKAELPIDIKVIWCDATNPGDIDNLIRVGTHEHTFFEIHFVFQGEVIYESAGEILRVSSSQALFLAPHTPHRYIGKSDDMFKLALAFRIDGESKVAEQLLAVENKLFEFSSEIIENTSFMLGQVEKNDIFTPYIISGRLSEIICLVCSSLNVRLPERRENSEDPRLRTAIEYIDSNKNRNLTCEDVARECCLSSKQLNRIFKNNTSKSLYKYIICERVKLSEKLLLQSQLSIKEISIMLGFPDESNFVSFFKRQCGMSPGVYRKQNEGR